MLGSLMKTKPGFALCAGKCPAAQTSVSQWWTAIVLHKHIPKIEPTVFMWRDPTAIETIGRALPSDNIPHPTIETSRNSLSFPSITHQDGKKKINESERKKWDMQITVLPKHGWAQSLWVALQKGWPTGLAEAPLSKKSDSLLHGFCDPCNQLLH